MTTPVAVPSVGSTNSPIRAWRLLAQALLLFSVSHLAAGAKELFVFQRTPSSIDVRNNTDIDEDWVKAQQPGWHHKRRTNFESLLVCLSKKIWCATVGPRRFGIFVACANTVLVAGACSHGAWVGRSSARKERGLKQYLTDKATVEMGSEKMEMADFENGKGCARADSVVENADTAESLKPYYRQFVNVPVFTTNTTSV